jgi:hypothetical protein
MAERWHYMAGANKGGPVSHEDLRQLVNSGRVRPTDLVWQEGMPDWVEARQVFPPDLFPSPIAAGAPAPPPLPVAEPLRPRAERRERDEGRGRDPELRGRDLRDLRPEDVPYPGKLRAAGILWVIIGGLILVGNAINVFVALNMAEGRGSVLGPVMCASLLVALFGGAFIWVGVQSITGTAPGVIGNAVGSIILGAVVFASGLAAGIGGNVPWVIIITSIEAAVLILAGILALLCHNEYKEWRYVYKAPERFRRDRDDRR